MARHRAVVRLQSVKDTVYLLENQSTCSVTSGLTPMLDVISFWHWT